MVFSRRSPSEVTILNHEGNKKNRMHSETHPSARVVTVIYK